MLFYLLYEQTLLYQIKRRLTLFMQYRKTPILNSPDYKLLITESQSLDSRKLNYSFDKMFPGRSPVNSSSYIAATPFTNTWTIPSES